MYTKLPNGQIIYEEDYSCIIEPQNGKGGIFIGNLEASQNLKTLRKNGIKAVLTAAKGVDLNHSKADIPFYLQVPGEDRDGFDLTRFYAQAISFIKESLESTNIMVHCLAGVSRSVCLVLAYFIKLKGMSYNEAYRLVKAKRNIIHPNDGFIAQLKKYQTQVRSQSQSIDPTQVSSHYNQHKGYSASPTKKKYEYYCSPQKHTNLHRYQRAPDMTLDHESPSKKNQYRSKYESQYQPAAYDYSQNYNHYNNSSSPLKRPTSYNYDVGHDYESPSKKRMDSLYDNPQKNYSKRPEIKRLMSLVEYKDQTRFSPEKTRAPEYKYEQRGRADSQTNAKDTRIIGNYDKYRHTSTAELSEQLDNKIAQIRQKYAEYTKSSISNTNSITRGNEPRASNYYDENDLGLSRLALKKKTSDYDHLLGNDTGLIKHNNLGRSSVTGLGLRKLNSMRDAY